MPYTSWLIGSTHFPAISGSNVANIDAMTDVGIGYGSYYLHELLDEIVAELNVLHPPAGWSFLKNRKVRIYAGGIFSLTWSSLYFRDFLGFTTDLSGASTYTSGSIPQLLWSPGRTESPMLSPLGTQGHQVHSTIFGVAGDGTTVTTTTGSRTFQEWRWSYIATDRIQTDAGAGGEYATFFDKVLKNGYNFRLYRNVDEDGTSADLTLGSYLGPYALTPGSRNPDWVFTRSSGFAYADGRNDITLSAHVVPEI